MNITYDISFDGGDAVKVTTARCQLALYGRWCDMSITAYCLGDTNFQAPSTAITFGIQDLKQVDVKPGQSHCATIDGVFNVARGSGSDRQQFQQQLSIPRIYGQLLDYSDLHNGGVPAGRVTTQSVLRRVESIIETIRQSIRRNLGCEVKEQTLARLHDRFGKITKQTIRQLLGEINWRFLLDKSGGDDDFFNVVNYAMAHNPPQFHSILHCDDTDIPLIQSSPLGRFDKSTIANLKATALLKNVCGEKLGEEFDKTGRITVKEHGYIFVIEPGQFVRCTDPNGKSARLCIHTSGFQVNPIDEVVIAYLHLRHKFDDYMKLAIVHGAESGFQRVV
jgi:hypothetical protein